jgi:hypothetical protein
MRNLKSKIEDSKNESEMRNLNCGFVHSAEMIQVHLDVPGTLTISCALHVSHQIVRVADSPIR